MPPKKQSAKNKDIADILKLTGHTITEFLPGSKVKYTCGPCGSTDNTTTISNIKRTRNCGTCAPKAQKRTYKDTRSVFTDANLIPLFTEANFDTLYVNKDTVLPCICTCGRAWEVRVADVIRGRKCLVCKPNRMEDKHGYRNVGQREDVKEKIRQTCVTKYGVPHHMQNPEILSKSRSTAYSTKDYVKPNGGIIRVQGYEDRFLDYVYSINPNTRVESAPTVRYTLEGKERLYAPDFYLPDRDTVIEVKSQYYYDKYAVSQDGNETEMDAKIKAIQPLHNMEVWIMNRDGSIRQVLTYEKSPKPP